MLYHSTASCMRWESEATSVEWVSCCSQQSAKIKYFFWLETIEWGQVMIHTVHYNTTDSEYVSDREREKAIIGKWAENVKQSFAMYNGKWKENEEKNCKIKSNREREREKTKLSEFVFLPQFLFSSADDVRLVVRIFHCHCIHILYFKSNEL